MIVSLALRECARLVRGGWRQGAACGPRRQVCMYGAMRQVAEELEADRAGTIARLVAYVVAIVGPDYIAWQDAAGRTVDEVAHVFERAADLAGQSDTSDRGRATVLQTRRSWVGAHTASRPFALGGSPRPVGNDPQPHRHPHRGVAP